MPANYRKCEYCEGKGTSDGDPCPACRGKGELPFYPAARTYTPDYRPQVGATVTAAPTDRGLRLSEALGSFAADVIEVHLAPTKDSPLDEGVWALLDEYGGEYPGWIARLAERSDNPNPEIDGLLVGPDEIAEVEW